MRLGGTAALLTALLLAVPACGGDGGGTSEPASNGESQATQEPIDYTEDLGTECLETTKGRVYEIEAGKVDAEDNVDANSFNPNKIKAPAGKFITVEITNVTTSQHDFASEELDCGSKPLAKGDSVTVSFEVPLGETDFYCTFHEAFMKGDIIGVN